MQRSYERESTNARGFTLSDATRLDDQCDDITGTSYSSVLFQQKQTDSFLLDTDTDIDVGIGVGIGIDIDIEIDIGNYYR